MKCQKLFSGKNNKHISVCHLLKISPSMLSIKIIPKFVLQARHLVPHPIKSFPILTTSPGQKTMIILFGLTKMRTTGIALSRSLMTLCMKRKKTSGSFCLGQWEAVLERSRKLWLLLRQIQMMVCMR